MCLDLPTEYLGTWVLAGPAARGEGTMSTPNPVGSTTRHAAGADFHGRTSRSAPIPFGAGEQLQDTTTLGLANNPQLQDGQQRIHRAVLAQLSLHLAASQQPTCPLPLIVRVAPDHRDPVLRSTTNRCSPGSHLFLGHGAETRPLCHDEARCNAVGCNCASTADPWDESAQFDQEALRALQGTPTRRDAALGKTQQGYLIAN